MQVKQYKGKQGGFVAGPILFGIALIVAVVAAMAMANRGTSNNSAGEQGKMNSAVMMKEATDLQDGISRLLADGVSIDTMTFDQTANTGLFQPSKGYAVPMTVPVKACASSTAPSCTWVYHKNIKLKDVGTDGAADYALVVGDLSLEACRRVNNALYNDAMTATPVSGVGALADYTGGNAIDMSASLANRDGRREQCVATSDSKYAYLKVVAEN